VRLLFVIAQELKLEHRGQIPPSVPNIVHDIAYEPNGNRRESDRQKDDLYVLCIDRLEIFEKSRIDDTGHLGH